MWTAKEIKQLRKKMELNQGRFANRCNTSKRSVIRWERGTKPSRAGVEGLDRLWQGLPLRERNAVKQIWYYPTNDFGDCRWVQVAKPLKSGAWTRWKWYPTDKVRLYHDTNDHTLVFQTIGHFAGQDKNGEQISNLCFDWDVGGETRDEWTRNFCRCKTSVKLAIEFFLDLGLDEYEIRVFFSGGRGFHLEIPYQALGLTPRPQINEIMKMLALDVDSFIIEEAGEDGLGIDQSLYNNPKMFRLPNARYPKNTKKNYPPHDTYKIEITHKELLEIETIDDFWNLARNPRQPLYDDTIFDQYGGGIGDKWYEATNWVNEIVDEHEEREELTQKNIAIYSKAIKAMEGVPLCISDLRQHGIKKNGNLHRATLLDINFCINAGVEKEETIEIIDKWSQQVNDSLTSKPRGRTRKQHTEKVVKYIYNSDDEKYRKFYCGSAHILKLACNRHKCPLFNKFDLRKHAKHIQKVENIEIQTNNKIFVDTVEEAREVVGAEIQQAIDGNTDLIVTLPAGVGKTTTSVLSLENISDRTLYSSPRHDLNDHVVDEIAELDWDRVLPRQPRGKKPTEKSLIARWEATALCPLWRQALKLGSLRYDVGRILCAEKSDVFENDNWCGIPKATCDWWLQFATKNSATLTHHYLFFPTLMDLLLGKDTDNRPAIIFDEPSTNTFIDTIIITPKSLTQTIEKSRHACVRTLLQTVRKAIEDTNSTLWGNATLEAITDAYSDDLDGYGFTNLLYHVEAIATRPHAVDIDAGEIVGETDTGKAYVYRIDGREILMPKIFEVFVTYDRTLFRVPTKFAVEKDIYNFAVQEDIDTKEVGLVLQFLEDLIKMLVFEMGAGIYDVEVLQFLDCLIKEVVLKLKSPKPYNSGFVLQFLDCLIKEVVLKLKSPKPYNSGFVLHFLDCLIKEVVLKLKSPKPYNSGFVLHFLDCLIKEVVLKLKSPKPYNSGLSIQKTPEGKGLVLKMRKHLAELNTTLITLDAAGNADLIKMLLDREEREVRVCDLALKMDCKIIQAFDGRYGIRTLASEGGEAKSSFTRLMKLVKNLTEIHDPQEILIVTWLECEKKINKMQENGSFPTEVAVDHFFAVRGSNRHKDRSVTIILGTPAIPPAELHGEAQALFYDEEYVSAEQEMRWVQYNYKDEDGNGWEIKLRRYVDPRMEILRKQRQEMEIYHAAHRTRPILTSGQTIYLLTNLPIDELPPTELVWIDDLLIETDQDFLFFEQEALDFISEHGGLWLEQAESMAGDDVSVWELNAWIEILCRRNDIKSDLNVAVDGNNWITVYHLNADEVDTDRIVEQYKQQKIKDYVESGDIAGLRKYLGLTQEELAAGIGYSTLYISQIETNEHEMSKKIVEKIYSFAKKHDL